MAPISGGNWNNSSQAGVWTLNLNNNRTNSNNNVGSRSDSGLEPLIGNVGQREAYSCMKMQNRFVTPFLVGH